MPATAKPKTGKPKAGAGAAQGAAGPSEDPATTLNSAHPAAEIQPLELPGSWELKRIDSAHTLYASWEAQNQFYTAKGKRSGEAVKIKLKDGAELVVLDIIWAKPETVRIAWPSRAMPREWLGKKPGPTLQPA